MRGLGQHRFRRSTLWLVLFIAILAGLGLARTGPMPFAPLLAVPFLVLSLRSRRLLALIIVIVFGISAGWWRGSLYASRLAVWRPLYGQNITLVARATEDAYYGKYKQLTFSAGYVSLENGRQLPGKVQLGGFGQNMIFQGDKVVATGKLRSGYGIYQAQMGYAKLRVVAHHPTPVSGVRRRFAAGLQSALPEPLAPFALGLLVGQRSTMLPEVKQDLLRVGLTHIIAVSGYNLTVILQASRRLLAGQSKRLSTGLSVGLIGVFLLLAGASASIVRAAIVSLLSILTGYYGRNLKPLNLIALAAAITAWANPVYLWNDLSWHLSFLAFFGVMVLAPLVRQRWFGRWQKSILAGVALESLCAELMTMPLVLHIFGQVSRVGLLANVLVVVLTPLAMLLSLVAGLAGMLAGGVAGWLAWPAVIVLTYMLDLAHLLAGLPQAFVEGLSLSLAQMLFLYACLGLLAAMLWQKTAKSAIITDMNETQARSRLA